MPKPGLYNAIEAIAAALRKANDEKVSGTIVIDMKDGMPLSAKVQTNVRLDLTREP